jgi:hypothetical protein
MISHTHPISRELWVERCAARYVAVTGLDADRAANFAKAGADQETLTNGPDPSAWTPPEDSADEDMSYWESDE